MALPLFDRSQSICEALLQKLGSATQDDQPDFSEQDITSHQTEIHHNIGAVATETNKPGVALKHYKLFNSMVVAELEIKHPSTEMEKRHSISLNELGVAYSMNRDWTLQKNVS